VTYGVPRCTTDAPSSFTTAGKPTFAIVEGLMVDDDSDIVAVAEQYLISSQRNATSAEPLSLDFISLSPQTPVMLLTSIVLLLYGFDFF